MRRWITAVLIAVFAIASTGCTALIAGAAGGGAGYYISKKSGEGSDGDDDGRDE